MVLNPRSYTLSEPFMVTLTPGEDDSVVEESNGIIIREITLEGTFGLTKKRAQGFGGAQGGGNPLSGTEHFNFLRNLFREYSARKKDPRTAATTQLIFHALRDDDHFLVSPRTFVMPRDARRTRVHYDYHITLAAIDEASAIEAVDESGFNYTDALRDLNGVFNDARAAIVDLSTNVSQIKRKVGNIQAVLGNAIQIVNAVGGFLSGVDDLINFPLNLVATIADQLARAADRLIDSIGTLAFTSAEFVTLSEDSRSIRRLEAAIDKFAMYDEKFQDTIENIEDLFLGEIRIINSDVATGTGGATDGSRLRVVAGFELSIAGLSIPRESGLGVVEIGPTDTVESIAAAAGTTPEAVIIINDLRPPYITRFGGPGIRRPGDTLLVPVNTGGGTSTGRGVTDYLTAEDALYGIDIAIDDPLFDREGLLDIRVDLVNGASDFALRRGIENVVQGLEITINTERGATVFIPDLGIRRNVGGRGTIQHVLLASVVLREAILSDTRVASIESTRVVLDQDVLTQEITALLVGQQSSAQFVLPFGRASAGNV